MAALFPCSPSTGSNRHHFPLLFGEISFRLLPCCRLTIEWGHGVIMSGMVIRRIVTAILPEVLFGDIMKTGLTAVTLVLLVSISGAAQRGTGSVCVAARIDDPFWKEPATLPNDEINSHGLKVRVDTRPVEEWPQRKSLKIDGLDTSERHLLVVLDSSGKPIESVRFKFSDYKSTDLCMTYDGYQGIGLHEATRRTPWCKCR